MNTKIDVMGCPHCSSRVASTGYGAYRCPSCNIDLATSELVTLKTIEKPNTCNDAYHTQQAEDLRQRCDVCGLDLRNMW